MDKVIIDGVDVSECEYANACDKKIKCVILQDDVCEIDPYCEGCNCYYKQLKRLEQENERLKLSERDLSRICQAFKKDIETKKSYTLKYYQTLQEIRNIAKSIYYDIGEKNKIITKINEVIGAEE